MTHRPIFTATPSPGDYVLSRSGVTWNVDQATDHGSVMRIVAGEPIRNVAIESARSSARQDKVDAWQIEGTGSYRMIMRGR
jgi:hypothetical protein